jgi:hypothetical protein
VKFNKFLVESGNDLNIKTEYQRIDLQHRDIKNRHDVVMNMLLTKVINILGKTPGVTHLKVDEDRTRHDFHADQGRTRRAQIFSFVLNGHKVNAVIDSSMIFGVIEIPNPGHFLYDLHDDPKSLQDHEQSHKIPGDKGSTWVHRQSKTIKEFIEMLQKVISS